jgi:hypothetical protein
MVTIEKYYCRMTFMSMDEGARKKKEVAQRVMMNIGDWEISLCNK